MGRKREHGKRNGNMGENVFLTACRKVGRGWLLQSSSLAGRLVIGLDSLNWLTGLVSRSFASMKTQIWGWRPLLSDFKIMKDNPWELKTLLDPWNLKSKWFGSVFANTHREIESVLEVFCCFWVEIEYGGFSSKTWKLMFTKYGKNMTSN